MRYHHVAIEGLVTEVPHTVITTDSLEQMMGGLSAPGSAAGFSGSRGFGPVGSGMPACSSTPPPSPPAKACPVAVNPDEIGILVNTSVCKDYLEPSTAALVHGNLGLGRGCLSDVGNACLGFCPA